MGWKLRRALAAIALVGSYCAGAAGQVTEFGQLQQQMAQDRFDEMEATYERARSNRTTLVPSGQFPSENYYDWLALHAADNTPQPWQLVDERTAAWMRHSPASVPAAVARAFALVFRAELLDRRKKWGGIDKLVADALQALMTVQAAGRRDVNWHTALLRVARMQGWDATRVRAAVEKAVAADPEPFSLYEAAAGALAADGGQSPQQLAWLVDLAIEKTRATQGTSMYARIYLTSINYWPQVYASPFAPAFMDWGRLNAALTHWELARPKMGVLPLHAAMACKVHDLPVATALMAKLGPAPDKHFFQYWGGPLLYDRCMAWIDAAAVKI